MGGQITRRMLRPLLIQLAHPSPEIFRTRKTQDFSRDFRVLSFCVEGLEGSQNFRIRDPSTIYPRFSQGKVPFGGVGGVGGVSFNLIHYIQK